MEQKKTVLIVEDEKNIVDILRFNLQREGYETLEAYDGETGLELARSRRPPVVLRQDVFFLPRAQMPHLIWADEWDKIFVESPKALVHGAAENPPRDSLQRRQIQLHSPLSFPLRSLYVITEENALSSGK